MRIGNGKYNFEWIENWIRIPDTESGRLNGRTHGVIVSKSGYIIIFHQADPAVLVYDESGKLLDSWGKFVGAHGMTYIVEGGKEYLWLTDEFSGEVSKLTLEGKIALRIESPNHKIYNTEKYSPTWVAVNEESLVGNGDIWVSDGYGSSYIHRYDKAGNYLMSISGDEGSAGKFNCPHSIYFSNRNLKRQLFISDRGNKRFQVYDSDGKFQYTFGEEYLGCPCGIREYGDGFIVPELCARLAFLDSNEKLIGFIGQNEIVCEIKGWPDHPKEFIQTGKFNSPHAAAADKQGNIFIVEWIKGGRVIKLQRI